MAELNLDKSIRSGKHDGRGSFPARCFLRPLQRQDYAAPAMYIAILPQLAQRKVTCERGGGGINRGSLSIFPAHVGQLSGSPFLSLEMSCSACAGLYVAGRGFRIVPPGIPAAAPFPENDGYAYGDGRNRRRTYQLRVKTAMAGLLIATLFGLLTGCGPRAHIPPVPSVIPSQLSPTDADAMLARQLAPLLYLQPDEMFRLERAVAVVHPDSTVIAYHLLWSDDVLGAWVPFTRPTDEELIWVGYDSTHAPTDLWTYWHGTIVHANWRDNGQIIADIQWGKHGSLPHLASVDSLPAVKSFDWFYITAWLLPDLWLGNLSRKGPWCFCGTLGRYEQFTRPLLLGDHLSAVIRATDAEGALSAVFGRNYSHKKQWPWQ
jgi:hypothetical protein